MNAEKYTQKALEAVKTAQSMAQENGNQYVTTEHLLYALLDQDGGLIGSLFGKMGVDCDGLLSELDTLIRNLPRISGGSGEVYASPEVGKILNLAEKTAEKLGLSVGDSFEVETADGGRRSLTLTGITENYVFTRLYLSQAQLKTLNGGALPAWNAVYGQTDCPTDAARASLSSAILACNYVSSVSFIEDTTQMFDGLIGCLNYVVMLVIVCAAALAAVVLYNLISVNLGERKKELATIKVLGFYDKEVYRYIFREIDLLSLIGSLVGLVVGIPLHQFIIRTVEMDQMMFIRSIAPRSFVFSVALTMLFNFAVCLLMRRHVRQISMVESMKAPE